MIRTIILVILGLLFLGACGDHPASSRNESDNELNVKLTIRPFRDSTTGCYGVLVMDNWRTAAGVVGKCP